MYPHLPPTITRLVILFLLATPLLSAAIPAPGPEANPATPTQLQPRRPQASKRMGQRRAKKVEPLRKKDYSSFLCPGGSVACPIPSHSLDQVTPASAAALDSSLNSLADWFKVGFECIEMETELNSCGGCLALGAGQDCSSIANARTTGCERGSCAVYTCFDGYVVSPDRQTCVKKGTATPATPVTAINVNDQTVLAYSPIVHEALAIAQLFSYLQRKIRVIERDSLPTASSYSSSFPFGPRAPLAPTSVSDYIPEALHPEESPFDRQRSPVLRRQMTYPMPHAPAGYSSRDAPSRDASIRIGPMLSAPDVVWALNSQRGQRDPAYVKAVFRSYVDVKLARGKTTGQVAMKLETLERELLQHAAEFHQVRVDTGLPPSRVLPAFRRSASNTLHRSSTSQPAARPGNGVLRVNTTAGVTTNRPPPIEDEELPPPPYASQDPEPDSTRILQERLAVEAEAEGRISPSLSTPRSPTFTTNYAPPPGAPPPHVSSSTPRVSSGSSHRRVSNASSSLQRRSPSPPSPPEDEEVAKVWEESQLDEAKRASIAAERERKELEQVMELSLRESEGSGQAAGESSAGHNSQGRSTVFEDEDGPNSRRVSSYATPARNKSIDHRRVASDAGASGSMPGQWQGQTQQRPPVSILDEEDNAASLPALTPSRTGAVLQSKNPFLSPMERDLLSLEEQGPSTATPSAGVEIGSPSSGISRSNNNGFGAMDFLSPTSPTRHRSASSLRDNLGSAYTSYSQGSSALSPSPPQEPRYTAPPGPPPAHLRMSTTPRNDAAPSLPPRPLSTSEASPGGSGSSRPLPRPPPADLKVGSGKLTNLRDGEDPLEMLNHFNTVFLVDDSASMAGERWEQARTALMGVAKMAAMYDKDGVDVYFLNSKRVGKELKAAHDVEDLFSGLVPRGNTPTGLRLESILRDYLSRLERSALTSPTSEIPAMRGEVKPLNLLVITDGAFALPFLHRTRNPSGNAFATAPTDDPESVLLAAAKRLDRGDFPLSQVGVQFLQIGDDVEAREALQELDDGLSAAHGVRYIVDTAPFTGEAMSTGLIIKTLLGGINRRPDRWSTA